MSVQFVIDFKNKNYGPLSTEELTALLDSNKISRDTYARISGNPVWFMLKNAPDLGKISSPRDITNPAHRCVEFPCDACKKPLKIPTNLVGKTLKCPLCQKGVKVEIPNGFLETGMGRSSVDAGCQLCKQPLADSSVVCDFCGAKVKKGLMRFLDKPMVVFFLSFVGVIFLGGGIGYPMILPPNNKAALFDEDEDAARFKKLLVDNNPFREFQKPSKFTYDAFLKIQEDMTYQETVEILREKGEELSRSSFANIEMVMYCWKNPDGSNLNVTFRNGLVISKAQFGLR
jgi:hypothetical protein